MGSIKEEVMQSIEEEDDYSSPSDKSGTIYSPNSGHRTFSPS